MSLLRLYLMEESAKTLPGFWLLWDGDFHDIRTNEQDPKKVLTSASNEFSPDEITHGIVKRGDGAFEIDDGNSPYMFSLWNLSRPNAITDLIAFVDHLEDPNSVMNLSVYSPALAAVMERNGRPGRPKFAKYDQQDWDSPEYER